MQNQNVKSVNSMSNRLDIEAQENYEAIIRLKNSLTESFLLLGEKLLECQQKQLYHYFGCETFEEYIAMPELGFKRAWVYELMAIYSTFVERLKVDIKELITIGATKLGIISCVINENNYVEWIEKAKNLSVSDLKQERLEYRQKKVLIGENIEEVILSLSARQVMELFLLFGNKDDKLYNKILKYREFHLVRDLQVGEIWRLIE